MKSHEDWTNLRSFGMPCISRLPKLQTSRCCQGSWSNNSHGEPKYHDTCWHLLTCWPSYLFHRFTGESEKGFGRYGQMLTVMSCNKTGPPTALCSTTMLSWSSFERSGYVGWNGMHLKARQLHLKMTTKSSLEQHNVRRSKQLDN